MAWGMYSCHHCSSQHGFSVSSTDSNSPSPRFHWDHSCRRISFLLLVVAIFGMAYGITMLRPLECNCTQTNLASTSTCTALRALCRTGCIMFGTSLQLRSLHLPSLFHWISGSKLSMVTNGTTSGKSLFQRHSPGSSASEVRTDGSSPDMHTHQLYRNYSNFNLRLCSDHIP